MSGFHVDTSGAVPELYLYGEITPPSFWDEAAISSEAVLAALRDLGDLPDLVVRINSPGGHVFEGVAIYNALVRHAARVRVEIDALAASIASVIAMAGDEIVMAGNAMMMIHQAWTSAWGNADELEKVVTSLRTVDQMIVNTYDARTGDKSTRDAITEWLAAETWMSPEEAVARGFAERIGELKQGVAAAVPVGRFRNTPKHLLAPPQSSGRTQPRQPEEPPGHPTRTAARRLETVRMRSTISAVRRRSV